MMISTRKVQEITLANLKNGEVTLMELNEIYKKLGFVFVVNQGKLTRIKKEIKH